MAASHHAVAAVLLIASLLVGVALSGPTRGPPCIPTRRRRTPMVDVRRTGDSTKLATDEHGPGYVAAATSLDDKRVKPECDDDDHHDGDEDEPPKKPPLSPNTEELEQELCSDCEEPKKPEPKPELTCNKVHAVPVREGETCYSVGQCAGLGQDDFLRFNPNICCDCDNLFVGQWVCLDATCAA